MHAMHLTRLNFKKFRLSQFYRMIVNFTSYVHLQNLEIQLLTYPSVKCLVTSDWLRLRTVVITTADHFFYYLYKTNN